MLSSGMDTHRANYSSLILRLLLHGSAWPYESYPSKETVSGSGTDDEILIRPQFLPVSSGEALLLSDMPAQTNTDISSGSTKTSLLGSQRGFFFSISHLGSDNWHNFVSAE